MFADKRKEFLEESKIAKARENIDMMKSMQAKEGYLPFPEASCVPGFIPSTTASLKNPIKRYYHHFTGVKTEMHAD